MVGGRLLKSNAAGGYGARKDSPGLQRRGDALILWVEGDRESHGCAQRHKCESKVVHSRADHEAAHSPGGLDRLGADELAAGDGIGNREGLAGVAIYRSALHNGGSDGTSIRVPLGIVG